jgi:uncharacterized protein
MKWRILYSEFLSSLAKMALAWLLMVFVVGSVAAQRNEKPVNWRNVHVLVYTKNGKGYVHENIPSAVACLQKLAKENGFSIEVSDSASVFSSEKLKRYSVVIFAGTNNDVFDTDEQRLAFRKYIEGGGGFVGIHSVVGTERNWKWFKTMLGGTFEWHPPFQKYKLRVLDSQHPSMVGLPGIWEKEDECYFIKEMYPGIKPVLAHDLTTLVTNEKDSVKIKSVSGPYSFLYPAAWYHIYDGGIVWITALGHDKKDYSDPTYIQHLKQGIEFVAQRSHKPDYSKAYATSKDDTVR